VRSLATRARADLQARVDALLRYEQARFDVLVEAAAPPPQAAEQLRNAVRELVDVRRAAA
jgi:hypothetical protein